MRLTTIGDHIKTRRLELKLTQTELAERLSVQRDTLSMWEARGTPIAVQYYPAIIEYLGYNPLPEPTTRGQAIAQARMSRGLFRARLAELTGIDIMTITRIEMDRPRTAKRTARVVCACLRLSAF